VFQGGLGDDWWLYGVILQLIVVFLGFFGILVLGLGLFCIFC